MRQTTIDRLRRQCEEARFEMQRHPADWAGTWEEMFEGTPEGDFKWGGEDYIADGDSIPFETDNDSGWSYNFHSMTLGRKNGREYVEFHTQWACGDHDTEGPYYKEDRDDPDFVYRMMTQNCCYSLLKQYLYQIYCAETGLDPLENCFLFDLRRRAGNRHVTFYVRYRRTVAGYRVMKSRKHGHSWKPRLSGLPKEVKHYLDAQVTKNEEHLHEVYRELFAGERTCRVGSRSASHVWELTVSRHCHMTLKISGEIPAEIPEEAYRKEIKRISSRNLAKNVANTLKSIKKFRKTAEVTA